MTARHLRRETTRILNPVTCMEQNQSIHTASARVIQKTQASLITTLKNVDTTRIMPLFNTKSTSPSTGNAPNNSIVNSHCYMAEEVHVKTTKIPQSRNLTPVTIMVADTIGTIQSRRLLKVLLDSGNWNTSIYSKRLI